jgi:hypothetical protein
MTAGGRTNAQVMQVMRLRTWAQSPCGLFTSLLPALNSTDCAPIHNLVLFLVSYLARVG